MRIDASQLQTYLNCPRQYKYKYIDCLHKIKYDERDLDKDFGKYVHTALELLYKGKTVEEAKKVFREQFTGLSTEKAKTPANGELLIGAYWEYWHKPINDLSDLNLTTQSVEAVGEFNLTNDLVWVVKIDLIAKSVAGYWAIDHKTTKKSLYTFFSRFSPNMAVSGYCYYVRLIYGQCSGFIPNVLQVGYRANKYKDEPAGFHYNFERDIVNRNNSQLDDWKDNVIKACKKLANDTEFVKNEGACEWCSYRELCNSVDDENIKAVLYEHCDPFEYLKGGENVA